MCTIEKYQRSRAIRYIQVKRYIFIVQNIMTDNNNTLRAKCRYNDIKPYSIF